MHILIPVLPLVAQELAVSPGKIQLAITLYLFGIAGGQLLYGPVSEKFGRRPTLLATLALYVGAGAVAGWATSIATLYPRGFLGAWPGRDPRSIPEQSAGDNHCDQ